MNKAPNFKMTYVKVLKPAPRGAVARDPVWVLIHVLKVSKINDFYKCAYCKEYSKVALHVNGEVFPHAEHSAKSDALANSCLTLDPDFDEKKFLNEYNTNGFTLK